jgi:hypothetical protein
VRPRTGGGGHVVPRVDDLHDPPARAVHRRHHEYHRLGGEIEVGQRVERVDVHADDLDVLRVLKLAMMIELIERRARLPASRRWS